MSARTPGKLVLDNDERSGVGPASPKSEGSSAPRPKSSNGANAGTTGRLQMDPSFAASPSKGGKSKSKAQVEAQEEARKQHVVGNVAAGFIPPQYVALGNRSGVLKVADLPSRKSSGGQAAPTTITTSTSPGSQKCPRSFTDSGVVSMEGQRAQGPSALSPKPPADPSQAVQAGASIATRPSFKEVEDALLEAARSLHGGDSDSDSSDAGPAMPSTPPEYTRKHKRNGARNHELPGAGPKRAPIAHEASSSSGSEGSEPESEAESTLGSDDSDARPAQPAAPPAGRSQSVIILSSSAMAIQSQKSILRRTGTDHDIGAEGSTPPSPSIAIPTSPSRPLSSRVHFDSGSPLGSRSRLPSSGGALVPTISTRNAAQGRRQSFLALSMSGAEGLEGDEPQGSPYVRIATGLSSGTMNVVSAFADFEVFDSPPVTGDIGSGLHMPAQRTRSAVLSPVMQANLRISSESRGPGDPGGHRTTPRPAVSHRAPQNALGGAGPSSRLRCTLASHEVVDSGTASQSSDGSNEVHGSVRAPAPPPNQPQADTPGSPLGNTRRRSVVVVPTSSGDVAELAISGRARRASAMVINAVPEANDDAF